VKYTDGDFIKLVRIDKNVKFFWHIDVFLPFQCILCQDVFAPVAYGSIYKLSIDNNKEERYSRVLRL